MGGLELDDKGPAADADFKRSFGSPSGLPVFEHEGMKICQSFAIECYVSRVAPKFAGLTAQQRAVDGMFAGHKEDALSAVAKYVFGEKTEATAEAMKTSLGKYLDMLEANVPGDGFINKLAFPTMADLAIFNIFRARVPILKGCEAVGFDLSKYTKCQALADRAAAADGVKEYLAS